MRTRVLSFQSDGTLEKALEALRAGALVAFPTDTVYGLGALAFDVEAVRGIYAAKGRPVEKAIPVLLGNARDMPQVAADITEMANRLAAAFWPGALTLVIQKNSRLPEAVSATSTVGVRVPDNAITRDLLQAAGPLAVTSANSSGGSNPSTATEVLRQLGGRIAFILDGGSTPGGIPSTVVDCTGPEPVILRAGPISLEEICKALE
jgi:L-threonylcarbamoyladenylate synthase